MHTSSPDHHTPCARSTQPPPPALQQTHGGIGAAPNRPSTEAWARSLAWLRTGLQMLLLWLGLGIGAAWADDELVTPGSVGTFNFPVLMFDVVASQPLTVTGLSTGVYDSSLDATFEIWTRPGTHVGNSSSFSGWSLLGTTAPMAVTAQSVVSLPLTLAVRLAAGDRQAFMIRRTDGGALGYISGSGRVGDQVAADSHLSILSGTSAWSDLSSNNVPRNLVGAVRYQPFAITTPSLATGTVGVPYTQALDAAWGGTGKLSWSATGLPDGLDIDPLTGGITGTPSTPTPVASTDNVSITVRDSSTPTPKTDTRTFTLTVAPAQLAITSSALPNAAVGQAYNQQLTASGGLQPLSWSATGFPAGLSISSSGVITGTPISPTSTPANVLITVSDSSSTPLSDTRTLTLSVTPFAITTSSALPNAAVGQAYSQQLMASGGLQPLSWSATGLPAGLGIDPATGEISGTPTDVKAMATKAAPLNVVVTVHDSSSPQLLATQAFTLTVAAAAQATPTPVPTLGEWALGLLALLTAAAGALRGRVARHRA